MLELKLLAFLRFSSSYVLGLSDYRDTTLHRFCSQGPLPSTGGTGFCTVQDKREKLIHLWFQTDTEGSSSMAPDAVCCARQERFSACAPSSQEKVARTLSPAIPKALFPQPRNVALFQFGFFFFLNWCNCYKLNLMF